MEAPPTCLVCCGPTSPRFAHCFACRTLAGLLKLPLTPVMPVHLCPLPGPLYSVLMGYKESPIDEARRRFTQRIRELFSTFFAEHGACVANAMGGAPDLVLLVPSTSRPGRASLERAVGLAGPAAMAWGVGSQWAPAALQRTPGQIGHMHPNAQAFSVRRDFRPAVRGSRVLLVDDIYVSGARAQSAAAALRLCGALRALIVPLGRAIRPERSTLHAELARALPAGSGHPLRCVRVDGPDQAVTGMA